MFHIYWEDTLVGMFSVLPLPSGVFKFGYRVHRIVILPDYQALGIGTKILDAFGKVYFSEGKKLYIKSSHQRIARHCRQHKYGWLETADSGKAIEADQKEDEKLFKNMKTGRPAYVFEYVSPDYYYKQRITLTDDDGGYLTEKMLQRYLDNDYYPIVRTGKPSSYGLNETEKICHKLGIRTIQRYVLKGGKLKKTNV